MISSAVNVLLRVDVHAVAESDSKRLWSACGACSDQVSHSRLEDRMHVMRLRFGAGWRGCHGAFAVPDLPPWVD